MAAMHIEGRAVPPRRTEFRVRNPDNVIVVENHDNFVIIRATEDNFSTRRKLFFIRHLAAEGYIPARFERIAFAEVEDSPDLVWRIFRYGRSHQFPPYLPDGLMLKLLGVSLVIWLTLLALTSLRAPLRVP